jgi:hypothetical protein
VSLPPEHSIVTCDSLGCSQQWKQHQQQHPQPPHIQSCNSVTDGLGLHLFNPANFENTLGQLKMPLLGQNQQLYLATQITTSHHSSVPHQIHSPSHEEPDHFLNDPAVAYYGYPQSPMVTHSHLDASILPTPQSHTAAHHHHLLSLEWAVPMASNLSFHLTVPPHLLVLYTHILMDTFIMGRHMEALTMEHWTIHRWIPMSSVNSLHCRCRSMHSTMAWFQT